MDPTTLSFQCPLPQADTTQVTMAHGGGGKLNKQLIEEIFLPALGNDILNRMEDQASLLLDTRRIAFTTDGYVVNPLFFPGGNIGDLAINGTINDLSVGGATPKYLSAAFIIEEGLAKTTLKKVVASMAMACQRANVTLVAGDTKVVERGKGDQLFITTTGIGLYDQYQPLSVANAKVGDKIIVSGTIGDHGCAIMSVREGLAFHSDMVSDTAPLHELTRLMLQKSNGIRCMRDATRGGLAATLSEIAEASRVHLCIDESSMPVTAAVTSFCEVLGLEPWHIANEGKLAAIVSEEDSAMVLSAMQNHPLGKHASIVGEVTAAPRGRVSIRGITGVERLLHLPLGDALPRIC